MSTNFQTQSDLTVAKNLHQLGRRNKASGYKFLQTYSLQFISLCQSLDCRKIDSLVFYTVDVLETKLRQTTLQRHLTAFETDFLTIARTLLGTLMTARRSATHARTRAATNSLTRVRRTICRF